jgi:hypothetical protein
VPIRVGTVVGGGGGDVLFSIAFCACVIGSMCVSAGRVVGVAAGGAIAGYVAGGDVFAATFFTDAL